MGVFCNLTEPNKFMANKKYPKNESVFLRGDCPVILLGDCAPDARANSLDCGCDGGVCPRGLIFGISPKIMWELGQRMLDMAAMCTAGWCALTHHSCLTCDSSNEAMHEKQGMEAPHKMGD